GGRRGPRPRARSGAGRGGKGGWLRRGRAGEPGRPAATLQSWRRRGGVQARKLPVPGGHWALWATAPERKRLTRLRQYRRPRRDPPIPAERTTPKAQTRK